MTADDALLAKLDASPTLVLYDSVNGATPVPNNVYDGYVQVNEAEKVIAVPLPYLAYYSSPGYDWDVRPGGQAGGRVKQFQLTGVGSSREQAAWVLEQARTALSRKRVTVDGKESSLIMLRESTQIRRDDDYTRPGGEPLFYGVEQYEVAI